MHTAEIAAQVTAAAQELLKIGAVKAGQVLVVGCSTSEVMGDKIGTAGSMKVAEAMFAALIKVTEVHGVFLAIQCCEHLNRALVTTRYAAVTCGWQRSIAGRKSLCGLYSMQAAQWRQQHMKILWNPL